MSNIGNKDIMSKNLKFYIEQSGMDRKQLAEIWGFPYSTVTDWINGKKYPRIDRIEVMADYFGILKSDLIEDKEKQPTSELSNKKKEFIKKVEAMSDEQLDRLEQILSLVESTGQ